MLIKIFSKTDILLFDETLTGYDKSSLNDLKNKLSQEGFHYKPSDLGGGGEFFVFEIFKLVTSWISTHPFIAGIAGNLVANRIEKSINIVHDWYKKNRSKGSTIPTMDIYIYGNIFKNRSSLLKLKANKKYTKHEILNLIKKQKGKMRNNSEKG